MSRKRTRAADGDRELQHVLVATDFTEGGGRAVERALCLPLGKQAQLSIANVQPVGLPPKLRLRAREETRLRMHEVEATALESLSRLGRGDIELVIATSSGEPHVEIIRHARSIGADLNMLGRHGRRPVKDSFIGSTAKRVIRHGPTRCSFELA